MKKRPLKGFRRNGLPKSNEPGSSATHLVGAGLAVAALVLMIVSSTRTGSGLSVTAMSIFGASLVILYSVSGIYHGVHATDSKKWVWQRLDHAMIFVLIAGTYTPVTLVVLGGGWGWSLFGVTWGIAITAFFLKLFLFDRVPSWFFMASYIGLGWIILLAAGPLLRSLSSMGLFWLVLGGLLYTVGTIFYGLEGRVRRTRWFGMHELFHLFAIAGSFSHFWLMLRHVAM